MTTLHQNPTFTCAADIKAICLPLQDLKIDYFSHVRVSDTKDFSFICSNPDFVDVYFEKKFYNIDINTSPNNLGSYVIWDDVPRIGKTLEMEYHASLHGVKHTFTIIKKNAATATDYYHFSSSVDTKAINQVYLANLDLLNLFIHYFNKATQSSKELSGAYQQKFNVDQDAEGFSVEDKKLFIPKKKILECYAKLSLPTLTSREVECVKSAACGRTAKAIARELGISSRTVEVHLENAKAKFNVESKSLLIGKWLELNSLLY